MIKIHLVGLFLVILVAVGAGVFVGKQSMQPVIDDKNAQLDTLSLHKDVYETMINDKVGVWCALAVHYNWLDQEDLDKANEVIASGVHDD